MIDIVVGGMYGSEAKGHVTQRLVGRRLNPDNQNEVWNIRVGGPNAGHTGHDAKGKPWAFRQVPVGVLVNHQNVKLEIGAGSEIDLPVLLDEIDRCTKAGLLKDRTLVVHGEATLIEDRHKDVEAGKTLIGAAGAFGTAKGAEGLSEAIGSTGKGIGAARADRLLRGARRVLDDSEAMGQLTNRGVSVVEGEGQWRKDWSHVVIEGTQGYALGLRAGHYPQSTTSDCRSIDFLSMAGISPWDHRYSFDGVPITWVVGRVFPIRVAGNSGPMKGETTWDALGLPEERTTVTKKVRRVGEPDWDLLARAVRANGGGEFNPTVRVALTMIDQAFPVVAGKPYPGEFHNDPAWMAVENFLVSVEQQVGARISLATTGPNTAAFRGL